MLHIVSEQSTPMLPARARLNGKLSECFIQSQLRLPPSFFVDRRKEFSRISPRILNSIANDLLEIQQRSSLTGELHSFENGAGHHRDLTIKICEKLRAVIAARQSFSDGDVCAADSRPVGA